MISAFRAFPRRIQLFFGLSLLCTATIYVALHGKYRPRNVDDAWSLSYIQSYLKRGSPDDLVFGRSPPYGLRYFGKSHARVVGALLDVFGWTKTTAHLISTVFLLLAVALWIVLLRRLKFEPEFALIFGVLMLLYEPFFSAAQSGRPEAFVFLLISLASLLIVVEQRFFALIAAAIAFESHPVGVVSFIYLLAFALRDRVTIKANLTPTALASVTGGLAAGAAFYIALHSDALATFEVVFSSTADINPGGPSNFLFDYFFQTKFYRHIPELVLFLACAVLYIKWKLHRRAPLSAVFCGSLILFSIVFGRPNFHYTIYVYPAFLLLAIVVADTRRLARGLWLASFILLVPQYGVLYVKNRDVDFARQTAMLRAAIPRDSLTVVGGFNDWFAFLERPFVSHQYSGDFQKLKLDEFYLIEDDDFRRADSPARRHFCGYEIASTLQSFDVNQETFVVRKMRRRR
ncbi:MAG: hypothetical protein HYY84_20885 [Deltaproteobacteria bacterium]|nr:hypothetical protein [Deltaproteobacteria bacterium]